jgi:hypothetical protein
MSSSFVSANLASTFQDQGLFSNSEQNSGDGEHT